MSTIEEVKARLDIVETVGSYVPNLKRSGRTWKANCPFHNERTPSFIVDPGRGSWHCFGACATGGDVIGFVQRIEGLEFREALARCAERAGVELRPPSPRERERRDEHQRLLDANEAAALFWQAQLGGSAGAAALAYAEGRGLDAAARREWQIGYAPDSWSALRDHLAARGFGDADLVAAGLAAEGDRGPYDRFRGRLIFPTRDERGRLVGFGGRALDPGQPAKYLNTPRTPLFDKGGVLYGLDRGGPEARREGRLVVVEGYMDVIACRQAGIANVAASMGTAVTEPQMRLIQRYTPNVVLALDADAAGFEAAMRADEVASGAAGTATVASIDWRGLVSYQDVLQADIRIAALPAGEDPDSLARSDPARLRELIEAARPATDHLFAVAAEGADLDDPRARSRAVEALAPRVAAIADPIVRAEYVQRLARLGRVDEGAVLALIARGERGGRRARPTPVPSSRELARAARNAAPPVAAEPPADAGGPGEALLLRLLLLRPECREAGLALDPGVFEDGLNRRLFEAWREDGDPDERTAELDDDLGARLASLREAGLTEAETGMPADLLGRRVERTAAELTRRRLRERVSVEGKSVAHEVAEARRAGHDGVLELARRAAGGEAPPPDAANGDAELAANMAGLSRRQRELAQDERDAG